MNNSVMISLFVVAGLLILDGVVISYLLIKRASSRKFNRISTDLHTKLLNLISGNTVEMKRRLPVSNYLQVKQAVELSETSSEYVREAIDIETLERNYLKHLNSWSKVKRIEAAVYLGILGKDKARLSLETALLKEQNYPVKLYMANALADIANKESIPVLISSLSNSHRWYRDRVNLLISSFGEAFDKYISQISDREPLEIKELIVDFASVYFSDSAKAYLIDVVDTKKKAIDKLRELYGERGETVCSNCIYYFRPKEKGPRLCQYYGNVSPSYACSHHRVIPVSVNYEENYNKLVYKAAHILARFYPKVLDDAKYLYSEDVELKKIAIEAMSSFNTLDNLTQLLAFLKHEDTARSVIQAVSEILERNPRFINVVLTRFKNENDRNVKRRLAQILSNKIEYFIMKLNTKSADDAHEMIKEILMMGHTSEVIDFLNKNKDIDLENELLAIVKNVISFSSKLQDEIRRYSNQRIAEKCGMTKQEELIPKKEEPKDRKLIRTLYLILVAILLFFPVLYSIRHYDILLSASPLEQVKQFVVDFNYYLAFYSIMINLIYLALLVLSSLNANKQLKLWRIKSVSLLFKPKMLPSISIVAPAYNEEKTIIESANSLLNLKYPDYELVIVNDGSKDNTLQVLINYFDLIRVDYVFDYHLNTKPVRGVYMNRSIPKLIVVDKENGGKADSLNTGINISSKEYFCGIDADSLLEDDALLKLASLTLDEGIETPALGGNIFPINGCTIERGQIKKIQIPNNKLAKFQTIEYIRAFMAGRLGWAYLNSLLIISGAFGLFRKERVISVGGYLTSSGRYAKDTVGEDMELVVRISRLMRELGHKYRICYAFNANCWTEVPEDVSSLKKQRYRWHKGLIDILTFHKKMLFNPSYGRTGILAMPYFLIFEMVGPIVESLGYLMVIAAFLLGLLHTQIALLLFISTILMGMLVSMSSLIIAEKDMKYFRLRDVLILVMYAIMENFGPRQLFSMWRVGGYLNMLKKPTGWDKPIRKGFVAKV